MWIFGRRSVVLLVLGLIVCVSKIAANENAANICCVPNEWEALAYLDLGTVFIDENTAFSYINGTVDLAYSYSRQKMFANLTGVEQTPLLPVPEPFDMMILYDFAVGTSYQVFAGECSKVELPKTMTQQCVPGDATLIQSGNVAGKQFSTYQYTAGQEPPYQITATVAKHDVHPVTPELCDPMDVVYFTPSGNPDSGTLTRLAIMDLGPIKDESVFNVPKQCQ